MAGGCVCVVRVRVRDIPSLPKGLISHATGCRRQGKDRKRLTYARCRKGQLESSETHNNGWQGGLDGLCLQTSRETCWQGGRTGRTFG